MTASDEPLDAEIEENHDALNSKWYQASPESSLHCICCSLSLAYLIPCDVQELFVSLHALPHAIPGMKSCLLVDSLLTSAPHQLQTTIQPDNAVLQIYSHPHLGNGHLCHCQHPPSISGNMQGILQCNTHDPMQHRLYMQPSPYRLCEWYIISEPKVSHAHSICH